MTVPRFLRNLTRDLVLAVATGEDTPLAEWSGPVAGGRRRRWFAALARALPMIVLGLALLLAMAATAAAQDARAPFALLIGVLSAAPLALVVHHPLWAWRLAWVAAVVLGASWQFEPSALWPWNPVQFVVQLTVLTVVAARQEGRVLAWVWALSVLLVWLFVHADARIGVTLLFSGLMLLGHQIGRRWQAQRRLAVEQERGLVLTERARIARELHDVVAHHMSLIAVRAESAPYRVEDLPAAARGEFAEIAAAARSGLTEMRRLLGVLRSDGTGDTAGAGREELAVGPQPRLADLAALVGAARAAGTDVELRLTGGLDHLPPAVDLSGYRLVQEALSNAARHAAGSRVIVEVHAADDRLELRVANGAGQAVTHPAAPGHGLRGMRERVAMLGGEVSALPTADGGFEVRAVLPVSGDRP